MTLAAATPRLVGALGVLTLTVGMLAACAPTPEPTPTPTALFSSDEEAYAAAEETYRAYTDATNLTDFADPETFEAVFSWLAGPAESTTRENYSSLHADKITRSGDSTFDSYTPVSNADELVTVRLCIDVSDVQLRNEAGDSIVPSDRPARQPIEVEFVDASTSTGLVIRSSIAAEEFEC